MLRDHGQVQKYYHDVEGYNGRLDAIQAAFLRIKLRRLDAWNTERCDAAVRYSALLSQVSNFAGGIRIPSEPSSSRAVYHLYVIRTPDRDALAKRLKAENISTGLHYPVPVHLQRCYREWGYRTGSLPVTEQVATEILSLPMFPGLTLAQQTEVAEAIGAFLGAGIHEHRP
jgi:dTDP-4-amino-4,6-dideoxygalactose transaminase